MFTEKDIERFNSKWKLKKKTGCWIWTAGKRGGKSSINPRNNNRVDYGSFWYNGNKHKTNRIAYQMFIGPIPEGKHVCHSCDNGMCVNPKHLFLGTNLDNVLDKVKKGRQAKGELVRNQYNPKRLTRAMVDKIRKEYPNRAGTRAEFAKKWGITAGRLNGIIYNQCWL